MPCSDGGYGGDTRTVYQDTPETKQVVSDLKNRCDELARYLCYTIGDLRSIDAYDSLPPEIQEWSQKHHEADESRAFHKMVEVAKTAIDYLGDPVPEKLAGRFIEEAEKIHPVSDWHKSWFLEMAETAIEEAKG